MRITGSVCECVIRKSESKKAPNEQDPKRKKKKSTKRCVCVRN